MTFHLGGGAGGMAHFLEHLLPAIQSWWADLGTPDMTKDLQRRLVEGVDEEVAGRSIGELQRWRDGLLTQIIALRQRAASREAENTAREYRSAARRGTTRTRTSNQAVMSR